MASELRVNTLKDASGNNSVATSVVFNGTAKAWIHYLGNASSDLIKDSYNFSSISDLGAGRHTVNYSSSFSNAFYACAGCSSTQRQVHTDTNTHATGSVNFETDNESGSFTDGVQCQYMIMGDLA
tara:strand:+ start:103 stop:477 length:375 start_codon:yes stop_codon:yes gene_type:complete